FIELILFTLLYLFMLFSQAQSCDYSVFQVFRKNRSVQIHMASTVIVIVLLVAAIHYLSKFSTLLTDKVSVSLKSVVHGLSYTDKLINVPKAYVLAAVVLI